MEPEVLRDVGKTETDAARGWCEREALLGLCWPRELTVCMTVCASGPSYGLMVAEIPVVDDVRIGGGNASVVRYARLAV